MPYAVEPFELLTTALSALCWRRENGSICMVCDSRAVEYYASLGLDFLWDDGMHPLLDAMPDDINATAFWAAGKLYAVAAMKAPCVMLDTDLICWKNIDTLLDGVDAAAIHREDIIPSIYPDKARFPARAALISMNSTGRYSRSTPRCATSGATSSAAITRIPPSASCARAAGGRHADLHGVRRAAAAHHVRRKERYPHPGAFRPALAVRRRSGRIFTHIWGFKQQMREDPALYEDFCRRCAARLSRDFPDEAERIAQVPVLSVFFCNKKTHRGR